MLNEQFEKTIKQAIDILKAEYEDIADTNFYDEPQRGPIIEAVDSAGYTMERVANMLKGLLK